MEGFERLRIYRDCGGISLVVKVVALKLSGVRFEKAVGYYSLNAKVIGVDNRFSNAQAVSRSSEGRLK